MIWSILAKVLLGVTIGAVASIIVTGDWIFTIVASFAFPGFILVALVSGLRRSSSRFSPFAIARVETAQRTGRERDGMQEISVRLVVAPEGEEPYQTSTLVTVAPDDLRRLTPGAVVVVTRIGPGRPDVTIVPAAPEEVMAAAALARSDPSLIPPSSTALPWESATTTTPGTRRPTPRDRTRSGVPARVLAITIILVSAVVTTIPAWGSFSRAIESAAAGDWDGTNLVSGRFQQEAVDAVAEVAGGYEFAAVYFYPDYLIVDAPTTPGATTSDTFMYRYGRAWREGPETIQPTDLAAELFDAGALDFSAVADAVELARSASEIEETFVFAYVLRGAEGEPVIHVSLTGDYGSESSTWGFDLRRLD